MLKERKYEETKIDRFIPNAAQKPFLDSTARITAFLAANKIGKTTAGVKKTWDFIKGGGKIFRIVTGLGLERGIRDTIIPEIKKWFPPSRILRERKGSTGVTVKMYIAGDNGQESVLSFMSDFQDKLSFEGDIIDGAWIDEPVPRFVYTATLRGLLVTSGPLFFTLTPLTEPWIYNEIYQSNDPEIQCFQGSIYDAHISKNGHLTTKQIESFVSKIPEEERPARIFGEFKHLIGRVYGGYDRKIHRIDPFTIPPDWPVWVSIDPHQRKPHAALFLAVSPEERWFICNEVYMKAPIEDFGREVLEVAKQYSVVSYLIDTSAETEDWSRRSTARTQLQKIGLKTRLARKHNQKAPGRYVIQQALEGKDGTGEPWLFVFNTCKRTDFEFMNYIWAENRDPDVQGIKEEPRKINDDMMDNLNYIVVENPRFARPQTLSRSGW